MTATTTPTTTEFWVLPPVRRLALVNTQVPALIIAKKAIKKSDMLIFYPFRRPFAILKSMSKSLLRGAGLKIAGVLLSLFIFIAAGTTVMRYIIGDPDTVKSTVDKSGIYDHLVDAGLSAGETTLKNEGGPDIPLSDPVIKDSLKDAFGPEVLQANFEKLVDGSYRWLDGSVGQPDFVLDFSASNETFVQKAGERLGNRLRGLPPCTFEQLRTLRQEVDAFKISCLPPGASVDQIVQKAQVNLRTNKDLLPDSKITADTFKKPGESQTVFASAGKAPEQFQLLMRTPLMLLVIIIALGAVIIFRSPSRPEGLKRLGKNLVICGILILLIPLGLYLAQSVLIDQKSVDANPVVRDITLPLLREFGKAAAKIYLIFGSITVLAGASAWLASIKLSAGSKDK